VRFAVNMASVDPATLQAMKGYLNLAWRLGLLMSEWQPAGASKCHLTYRGEVTQRNTKLLTSAFCAGLLEKALEEDVNIVNADVLLRERGIQLTEESRADMGAFSSSMTVEVTVGGKSHVASGTLFGNNMPRLIRLDEWRLEAYIDGNLLVFTHSDVPGIIGAVGTIFGKHNVNIGQMTVGRAAPGGTAVGVLNLDGVPPKEAIDEVLAHPSILSVRLIPLPTAEKLPAWLGW
jgi:D-3-phosphoglycerate dehydrogenase